MSASDLVEIESKKHYDGSDCIGCSPPPRLRRQAAVVDLEASSEDWSASQSQESQDASNSPLPIIPEDEEEAMEDDPEDEDFVERCIRLSKAGEYRRIGKSYLN